MRHGQSTWNREHRIQGQLDPPLSDDGRLQAAALARRLAGHHFEGFYASDLQRAWQTAEAVAAAGGRQPEAVIGLREIFLGDWEGMRTAELAERFPEAWAKWTREPDWDLVSRGERATKFEARVSAALDAIFDRHPHGEVLVVTHGGVIQVALHRVVGRPSHGLFPFKIENASISIIEKRGTGLVIACVNDTAHLEAVHLPA